MQFTLCHVSANISKAALKNIGVTYSNKRLLSNLAASAPDLTHANFAVLKHTHQLNVRQKEEWIEIVTGFETNNKYDIFNNDDKQLIFKANEQTSTWNRLRYGRKRPYTVEVTDTDDCAQLVMKSSIQPTGKHVHIELPPGTLFATIREEMVYLRPSFWITDTEGKVKYKITSPVTAKTGSFKNVNFEIYCNDGERNIGHITKKWSGLFREYFTDADFFELVINDGEIVDVEWKAVLLAATLVVDFEFYEKRTTGVLTRLFYWSP